MHLEERLAALQSAIEKLTATLQGARVTTPVSEAAPEAAPATTGSAGRKGKPKSDDTTAQAPAAPAGMTAEELTAIIVATAGVVGQPAVRAVLKNEFGVSAGKEITDPAVRRELATRLEALKSESPDLS